MISAKTLVWSRD